MHLPGVQQSCCVSSLVLPCWFSCSKQYREFGKRTFSRFLSRKNTWEISASLEFVHFLFNYDGSCYNGTDENKTVDGFVRMWQTERIHLSTFPIIRLFGTLHFTPVLPHCCSLHRLLNIISTTTNMPQPLKFNSNIHHKSYLPIFSNLVKTAHYSHPCVG
jgi:hypothetical protein